MNITRLIVSAAYLALAGPGRAAAGGSDLEITVATGGSGLVVGWSGGPGGDGYSVVERTTFDAGAWQLAGSVDQWPASETNRLACGGAPSRFYRAQHSRRGNLVDATLINMATLFELRWLFLQLGVPVTPRFPVRIYRVRYETFDHRGLSTLASGALALPDESMSAPLVSCQHGTCFLKGQAPSNPEALEQVAGAALATDGYVVALPDYIGLGSGAPGLHPYVHARSEAVACVDFLRAVRTYLAQSQGIQLDGKLFLAGYSQGGHATLALQRELELRHAAEFPITASAPMAGPYDLSGTMAAAMLADTPYAEPAYLAYLLFGYNAVYRLFASAADVLAAPYADTLPPLMDGLHDSGEISAAMPAVPKLIFKPDYLAAFAADTNHVFRLALRANDLLDWTPRAPTRLYHASGDTKVPFANSVAACNRFAARGSTSVTLIDLGPALDHEDAAAPALMDAKAWFDSLR